MKQLIITKLMPAAACFATVQAADVFPFEQELDACLAQLNAISGLHRLNIYHGRSNRINRHTI